MVRLLVVVLSLSGCLGTLFDTHSVREKLIQRGAEDPRRVQVIDDDAVIVDDAVVADQYPYYYCEQAAIEDHSSNETCTCNRYDDGVVELSCLENCLYCGVPGISSCGQFSFATNLTDGISFNTMSYASRFQYDGTGGRYELISVEEIDCNDIGECSSCRVLVNGTLCNGCSFCSNGFVVDCENIAAGSSFDSCLSPPGPGLFEGLTYDLVECVAPPPPANDICLSATPVVVGGVVSGTLSGATEDIVPTCQGDTGSNGVWYSFIGTGTPVLVSTCSSANTDGIGVVAVYQGSGCDLLECTDGYFSYCPGSSFGSLFLLPTTVNSTYFVYVSGWFGSFGTFDLSVTTFSQPSNVQCSVASEIAVDGSPVIGTIDFGQSDGAVCSARTADALGVAWYRFVAPQDATLRASTCNNFTIGWTMSTIAIASGSCDALSCLERSELYSYYDTCSEGGSFVDFQVTAGSSYQVVLSGGGYGNLGLHELDIRPLSPPGNDNCASAQSIEVPANFTSAFTDVTLSSDETGGVCFDQIGSTNTGGIWYSFVGTGAIVIATACSTDFPPYLTIHTGSCGALQCASPATYGPPNGCSGYGQQTIPMETVAGTVYYVLLSGSGPISGSFDFALRTVPPVENDSCLAAIEIKADGQVIIGNTEGAIYEDFSDSCQFGSRSPGVWYAVVGNGGMLRADTCSPVTNFDTVISVYRGSCENLQCVGANDDGCQSLSSSFTWDTEEYETYYILVNGFGDGQVGEYGFKVAPFVPAVNDGCTGAINLAIGAPLPGTMEGASSYNESYACYGDFDKPTLWYYIDGTGTAVKVSTCSPNSTFYGGIQAFEGITCSDLECVGLTYEGGAYSDNDCPYSSAATWFFAEVGLRYYVLLIDDSSGGANSTFTLTVTEFQLATNDVCETALPITLTGNETVEGSTSNALPDNVTCNYFSSSGSSPGVWYSVVGTGNTMAASTCSSTITFDSSIYVLTGGCSVLECVATSQSGYSACGNSFYIGARVSFRTEVGAQYYILVTGSYSSSFGDFGLSLDEIISPPNDVCSGASGVNPNSGLIVGSLSNATSFFGTNYTCAYDPNALSVWYSVVGTGEVLAISTCSSQLNFDSAISISTGACDEHVCVTSNAYNSGTCPEASYSAARITIRTEVGVVYFIAVEGLNVQSEGDFGLSVSTLQPPVNDECPGAILIQPDAGTISGSITNATGIYDFNTSSCGYIYDAPDVWYTLIGTGAVYAVSTCSSVLNFDASISISRGSCDLQECVLFGTYDSSGCTESSYSASRAVFRTEVGVVYFIAVQGANYPSEGDFTLEFSLVETPPNDECLGAIVIAPDNTTIRGSLVNATSTAGLNASCEDFAGTTTSPGVWFSIIGTGEVYLISTCSSELTFDSALSVSTGSCENQTCIAYGVYNDYECTETTFASSKVIFSAEVGVEYHIHVQSLSSSSEGDFELYISTAVVPVNDACSGAISIPVGTESVLGSITNATGPPIFSSSCSFSNDVPDVWYTMIGTGDVYAVSTCSSVLNFASGLSVSKGSCSNQECIAASTTNDETCDNGSYMAARVLFLTEVGVQYFIAVQGISYASEGNFELQISTVAVPPNDECTGALPVVPGGGPIFGSTSLATYSGTNSSCSGSDTSPDLWYRVEGNGTTLTASTCGDRTNYDSQITIFEGVAEACDTTCIVTNDDFCGVASQIEWLANAGVTYYIRVHGFSSSSGSFVLQVTGS